MILDAIADTARLWVLEAKKRRPLEEMKEKALALSGRELPFEQTINHPDMAFICEAGKTSPFKEVITPNFPYTEIVRDYEIAGASAIPVLTRPGYFMGCNQCLTEIKNMVQIPLLRKDFVVDEHQIYETETIGANAVLLIYSLLDTEALSPHISVYDRLGLSALVGAHTREEVLPVCEAGMRVIRISNRDLKTFEVDFNNSIQLCSLVSPEILFVAGSDTRTAADIHMLYEVDANTALIGETPIHLVSKRLELDKPHSGCHLM